MRSSTECAAERDPRHRRDSAHQFAAERALRSEHPREHNRRDREQVREHERHAERASLLQAPERGVSLREPRETTALRCDRSRGTRAGIPPRAARGGAPPQPAAVASNAAHSTTGNMRPALRERIADDNSTAHAIALPVHVQCAIRPRSRTCSMSAVYSCPRRSSIPSWLPPDRHSRPVDRGSPVIGTRAPRD